MEIMYLGEAVRQRRKSLGLTLEIVCEGLCTIMTLSRFEKGRQTPSRDCVVAILQRLGLPDDRYCAQLTQAEALLTHLRTEINAYCSQFEQTIGEEQQQARKSALEKLRDLERCVKKDDRINQQFILGMRATLEPYPPQEQLEMLMKAIRLTVPRFDPEEISNCLYCRTEVVIINQIAIRYFLCGQQREAINIYEQLLKLILKRDPDHNCLHLITYNYALYLALENRFEEALDISALGREVCIKQGNYSTLPGFLHIEAGCYYYMGESSRSISLHRSAYHLYGAIMDTKNQEILKTDAKKRFNLTF
ncbi:MAG: helix-turn-helix domain-containing protein [Oscillibacter sp.]|nr:helix-turn-helix domain-containing protein [Oscillibacter sp.]